MFLELQRSFSYLKKNALYYTNLGERSKQNGLTAEKKMKLNGCDKKQLSPIELFILLDKLD